MNYTSLKKIGYLFGNSFSADKLFGSADPEVRRSLEKVTRTEKYASGAVICAAGSPPAGIYILRGGEAELKINDDRFQGEWLLDRDEIVGLTETLVFLPSEAEVKTLTPCTVESIRKEDFLALLERDPQLCFRLVQLLAANLQKTYRHWRAQSV